MGKQPPPPPPQDEPDGMPPLPDSIVTGLAHPEENLFGDEDMMPQTEEFEELNEDDMPTICMKCERPVTMCIC